MLRRARVPVFETPIQDRQALRRLNDDLEAEVSARDQYRGPGCPER